MQYKCVVCKKKFGDLMIHLHKNESILLKKKPQALGLGEFDVKESHLQYFREVNDSVYKALITNALFAEKKCFCGGKINVQIADMGESWVCQCEKCGFLWDED